MTLILPDECRHQEHPATGGVRCPIPSVITMIIAVWTWLNPAYCLKIGMKIAPKGRIAVVRSMKRPTTCPTAFCNDAALHGHEAGRRVECDTIEGALLALTGRITGAGKKPFPEWHAMVEMLAADGSA